MLFGIEKFKQKDSVISLISLKLSTENHNRPTKREIRSLSSTAVDLFHLINESGKLHKLTEEVTIYLIDDQIQKTETDICGIFQLHFYKNLFQPSHESKIINDRKLTENTISKLLNEIFSLDRSVNKEKMETFAEEKDIKSSYCRCL